MHARLPLLLAALAGAAAVPLALLVDEPRAPATPGSVPLLCGRPADSREPIVAAPEPEVLPVAAAEVAAVADPRDATIFLLREALRAAAERNAELTLSLAERDALWMARLTRRHLEDDLHQMLRHEFPDLVELEDPNGDEMHADELVTELLRVAEWLGPETVEEDGEEVAGPRLITLADLRLAVSDSTIRRLSPRLVWWNLQLALSPKPGAWYEEVDGETRSGRTLPTLREIAGEVVTLQELRLHGDDPRIQAARAAHAAVRERRQQDLEALLGLPAGALE